MGGISHVFLGMIIITEHAYDRANERLSWSKKILDKMALKAYKQGKKHKETKGHLTVLFALS